jgi:hypothetical protein
LLLLLLLLLGVLWGLGVSFAVGDGGVVVVRSGIGGGGLRCWEDILMGGM